RAVSCIRSAGARHEQDVALDGMHDLARGAADQDMVEKAPAMAAHDSKMMPGGARQPAHHRLGNAAFDDPDHVGGHSGRKTRFLEEPGGSLILEREEFLLDF